MSNLSPSPSAISTLRRELRAGGFDVVHLHEPVAPVVGWDALTSMDAPLVGTFHCYSESVPPHKVAALLGRTAQAQPAERADRGVARPRRGPAGASTAGATGSSPTASCCRTAACPRRGRAAPGEPLQIVFVGQAVERKGLPVLLRAFEALRGQVPAELTVIGLTPEELAPLLVEGEGVTALGRVDDAVKAAVLRDADVLCAPSLGGESFGMVLTEAFAAGTPVVASDIAGYRDVVSDGVDGLLVPRGDATALAETLRDLALDRAAVGRRWPAARPRAPSATRGRRSPSRSSRPTRTRAAVPEPVGRRAARGGPRSACCRRTGCRACPRSGCRRWSRRRNAAAARRCARGRSAWPAWRPSVGAVLAVDHIGPARIGDALVRSSRRGCCSAWR